MSALTNLKKLDLSHNKFLSVPTQLCKLQNLQTLNLSYNTQLNGYSENVKALSNIKLLNLKGTALNEFQLNHITDLTASSVVY